MDMDGELSDLADLSELTLTLLAETDRLADTVRLHEHRTCRRGVENR